MESEPVEPKEVASLYDVGAYVRPTTFDGVVLAFDPGRAGAGVCIELRTGTVLWAAWWREESPSAQSKKHPGYPVWVLDPSVGFPVQSEHRSKVLTLVELLSDDRKTPPSSVRRHYVIEGLFIAGGRTHGRADDDGNVRLPLYEDPGEIRAALTVAAGKPIDISRPLASIWRRTLGIKTQPAEEAELEAKRRARTTLATCGFFNASTMRVGKKTDAHLASEGAVAEALMMARWCRQRVLAGFGVDA